MAQELGRIILPGREQYLGKRILLLVPLLYGPGAEVPEGQAILDRYWSQVLSQLVSLELRLGPVKHIYHESLTEGGLPALAQLEESGFPTVAAVRRKVESGAFLEATENGERLLETIDLQRCLMLPLASEPVARRLYEWFAQSLQARYQHIASVVDQTLRPGEVGVMFISERHQVQFPQGMEVFFVAPPALDEYHHWLEEWLKEQQALAQAEMEAEAQGQA